MRSLAQIPSVVIKSPDDVSKDLLPMKSSGSAVRTRMDRDVAFWAICQDRKVTAEWCAQTQEKAEREENDRLSDELAALAAGDQVLATSHRDRAMRCGGQAAILGALAVMLRKDAEWQVDPATALADPRGRP